MSSLAPITKFLPDVVPARGPFGMLGIAETACDEASIARALRAQLERIARHPHGRTVEADEVRLALHVAAAQLRDPAVREQLLDEMATLSLGQKVAVPAVSTSEGAAAPQARVRATPTAMSSSFEFAAMWVIAHSGGWSAEAQRRLWALSHAMSVDPTELPSMMARISDRVRDRAAPAPLDKPGAATDRAARYSPRRKVEEESLWRRWGVWALIAILTLSSIVMVRFIVAMQRKATAERTVRAPSVELNAMPGATVVGGVSSDAPFDALIDDLQPAEIARATGEELDGLDFDDGPAQTTEAVPQEAPAVLTDEVRNWVELAKRTIAASEMRADGYERLFRAVKLARANAAAEAHWSGELDRAREIEAALNDTRLPSERGRRSATELSDQLTLMTSPGYGEDGRVAMLFQAARRQPGAAIDAIHRMRFRQTALGPVDCDVIAESALFGPSIELRNLAQRFVVDQSGNPMMLFALLETVHLAPRNRPTSELIGRVTSRTLPEVSDANWPRAARAAILERLVEALSGARAPGVDELSHQLSEICASSLHASSTEADADSPERDDFSSPGPGMRPAPGGSSPSVGVFREAPPDARVVSQLVELWKSRALGGTQGGVAGPGTGARVNAIELRRQARLALASGPAQRWLAEQSTIIELAGLVIGAERPSRAKEIAAVLERASSDRRSAGVVYEQIEATERALVRLWMIRLGAPEQGLAPVAREGGA